MDDEQPKQRWNTRPESTIAQNFAADLDSMFGLGAGASVDTLARTVDEKKQTVTSGEQQLQELEAKLRETEERLKRVSRHNSPSRQPNTSTSPSQLDSKQAADGVPRASPLAQKPTYPADRPPTSGERPSSHRADAQVASETPQYNGGNYHGVDSNGAQRGYG